jgi:hypothetical protein
VIPYLASNRLRPRILAIQRTRPITYRTGVLGRALLAARADANSFWMILSGNAEVVPSTTATIAVASSLLPTATAAAAATSTANVTAAVTASAMSVLATTATDSVAAAATSATLLSTATDSAVAVAASAAYVLTPSTDQKRKERSYSYKG